MRTCVSHRLSLTQYVVIPMNLAVHLRLGLGPAPFGIQQLQHFPAQL